jgi:uracil-DNA glycosylase
MTIEEYFGDWMKVIDKQEAIKIMKWLKTVNPSSICPSIREVFKAFELCPYTNCKAVFIGQDPYPQKCVATGILFGNRIEVSDSKLSPSLEVIKEAVIDYEIPHGPIYFDNTLETWAKQGILMINSALTCELNKVGSHVMIWRPFISKLLQNYSVINPGTIYVLFGKTAQTFKPYISNGYIIEVEHPAYFARTGKEMPVEVFQEVNKQLKFKYNTTIEWYKEI